MYMVYMFGIYNNSNQAPGTANPNIEIEWAPMELNVSPTLVSVRAYAFVPTRRRITEPCPTN